MSQLIVMLTNNDITVPNALELFDAAKELPVKFWGFKDLGLPQPQMKELIGRMKAAGKNTFLESVCYREEECLLAADIAVECGVDYLTGTIFYDSIPARLKGTAVKYYPFFGKISGHPVILEGEIDEIVRHGEELRDKGVDGLDLVAYRYLKTDQIERLVRECVDRLQLPMISAGSINGWTRLDETIRSGIWAFTIGSAFFEKAFEPGASFNDQIMAVWRKL